MGEGGWRGGRGHDRGPWMRSGVLRYRGVWTRIAGHCIGRLARMVRSGHLQDRKAEGRGVNPDGTRHTLPSFTFRCPASGPPASGPPELGWLIELLVHCHDRLTRSSVCSQVGFGGRVERRKNGNKEVTVWNPSEKVRRGGAQNTAKRMKRYGAKQGRGLGFVGRTDWACAVGWLKGCLYVDSGVLQCCSRRLAGSGCCGVV